MMNLLVVIFNEYFITVVVTMSNLLVMTPCEYLF